MDLFNRVFLVFMDCIVCFTVLVLLFFIIFFFLHVIKTKPALTATAKSHQSHIEQKLLKIKNIVNMVTNHCALTEFMCIKDRKFRW